MEFKEDRDGTINLQTLQNCYLSRITGEKTKVMQHSKPLRWIMN